jgi:hypothetical protein
MNKFVHDEVAEVCYNPYYVCFVKRVLMRTCVFFISWMLLFDIGTRNPRIHIEMTRAVALWHCTTKH